MNEKENSGEKEIDSSLITKLRRRILVGDSSHGNSVRGSRVGFQGGGDGRVVEFVTVDHDRAIIHGRGHSVHETRLIRGAVLVGQVNGVETPSGAIATENVEDSDVNRAFVLDVAADAVDDFGFARGLLVGGSARMRTLADVRAECGSDTVSFGVDRRKRLRREENRSSGGSRGGRSSRWKEWSRRRQLESLRRRRRRTCRIVSEAINSWWCYRLTRIDRRAAHGRNGLGDGNEKDLKSCRKSLFSGIVTG